MGLCKSGYACGWRSRIFRGWDFFHPSAVPTPSGSMLESTGGYRHDVLAFLLKRGLPGSERVAVSCLGLQERSHELQLPLMLASSVAILVGPSACGCASWSGQSTDPQGLGPCSQLL